MSDHPVGRTNADVQPSLPRAPPTQQTARTRPLTSPIVWASACGSRFAASRLGAAASFLPERHLRSPKESLVAPTAIVDKSDHVEPMICRFFATVIAIESNVQAP